MKKLFAAFLFISPAITANAQDSCEVCKLVNKPIDTVFLRDIPVQANPAHNVSIRFLDYRPDSSKIGYDEKPGLRRIGRESAKTFFPYQLEQGTAKGLSEILSKTLFVKNSGNQQLAITAFLKVFWISEYDSFTDEKGFDKAASKRNRLVYSADYFLEKDGLFYPFAQIDTTFMDKETAITKEEHVIQHLIGKHIELFGNIVIEKVLTRKSYPIDFVRNKYKLEEHPITAVTKYKKGIYQNFQEFLNNSPGMIFKEFKPEKDDDALYAQTEKGEVVSVRDVWGFSDGEKLYVKLGFNFFQAVKSGGTFELLGFTGTHRISSSALVDVGMGTVSVPYTTSTRYFYPMQINMETGKHY